MDACGSSNASLPMRFDAPDFLTPARYGGASETAHAVLGVALAVIVVVWGALVVLGRRGDGRDGVEAAAHEPRAEGGDASGLRFVIYALVVPGAQGLRASQRSSRRGLEGDAGQRAEREGAEPRHGRS